MKNIENIVNKRFIKNKQISKSYDKGLKGQDFVELRYKRYGYSLFVKNFKKIGLELDLVVFKYIKDKDLLIIHIIEVKTRSVHSMFSYLDKDKDVDLENFGLVKKWKIIRRIMFDIVKDIKNMTKLYDSKHKITFDLAVVYNLSGTNSIKVHKYIQNVNLLL